MTFLLWGIIPGLIVYFIGARAERVEIKDRRNGNDYVTWHND